MKARMVQLVKVNLLINRPDDVRSGYLNLDPAATPESRDGRVHTDLGILAEVDAGECQELVAHDILDAFPIDRVDAVLGIWLSKLAHKGRLSLSVPDLREVSRAYLAGGLTAEQANLLLHGDHYRRQCSFSIQQLCDVLSSKGYKIVTAKVANFHAILTVERP